MAESMPQAGSTGNTSALERLEHALAEPEPMCLALVQLELPAGVGAAAATGAILAEAEGRLRDTLRDYDELTRIDDDSFVLVLRTLAGGAVLSGRMDTLFSIMSAPYVVDGVDHRPLVLLGAAVRVPQETAGEFVGRAFRALTSAGSAGGQEPVLI